MSRKQTALPDSKDEPLIAKKNKLPKSTAWLWLALPAGASVELLAVTNKITQDIAVVPFLWVLPLGLYLLSFIFCFEHQRWYKRWLFVPLFILGIIGTMVVRFYEIDMRVSSLIGLYVFMLFNCCMVCHGELYRLRPAPQYLTGYYLMIAAGGALGGFFVAVVCPLIFNNYVELNLGLLACALFLLLAEEQGGTGTAHPTFSNPLPALRYSPFKKGRANKNPKLEASATLRRRVLIVLLFVVGTVGILFMGKRSTENQRGIDSARNFFGVLTIWEEDWNDPAEHKLLMQHGTTFHGLQFQCTRKEGYPDGLL